MATTSEIKEALKNIETIISSETKEVKKSKTRILSAQNILLNIPVVFSDAIATINEFPSDGTLFQRLIKEELSLLTAEFQTLKLEIDDAVVALTGILI